LRVNKSLRAPNNEMAPINKRIAVSLSAIASLSSVVAFCGWLFGDQMLRSFGIAHYPIWPLTSLGYVALSSGLVAWLLGKSQVATWLWIVPIVIALLSIVQTVTGANFGTDLLLFGDAVSVYRVPHPGRPGTNPSALFLLLAIACYAMRARGWRSPDAGALFATVALSLVAAAAMLIAFSTAAGRGGILSISLPSAITAGLIVAALVVIGGDLRWVRALAQHQSHWRTLRTLLPVALILPIMPSAIELVMLRNDLLSARGSALLVVLCNLLIVAVIVYWAVTRVAREQAAMAELTQALDATAVVLATPEGVITQWSRGCERLYGWTADEARGQNKYALLRSRSQSIAPGLPLPGENDARELVEITRTGREIAVLEQVFAIASPGRAPMQVLAITDMSDRVAMLEALSASEERLALATSAHELGVFEWDVPSGKLEWSPGTEQRLGILPGTIRDFDSWAAMIEPADLARIRETVAAAIRERAAKFSYRYRFRTANNGVRSVEGSSRAFYDAEGKLLRTVGAIIDVTERDERETAIRRREAQLQSILETVPDAMVVIDECSIILQFSTAAEKLWGYRAAEVLGQPATILVPEDTREAHMATLERYTSKGEGLVGRTYWATALSAAGRRFPVEIRAGVARVDERLLLTMFVSDMGAQMETEARLSELNAEIAHVSRQSAMSELAADLAHELNQPLAATSNFLAAARMLVQRGEGADKIADLLRMGNEQTQRAGEIIRRMRAFMARGEVEMRTESIERTVRDAAELVLVGTAHFNVRVNYQLDPEAPLVFADRIQVQQVLVNLMRNAMEALKKSDEGERAITISSHRVDDQMIELAVSDNGPGIPVHVLENMFSRFTTTKGNGGGMGIGLSISKRIIEAHGGTLTAENKPEGGASFRFTLPTVEQGVE
jgi:two-component system, LuxR family, sensor kinase FixL